MDIFDYPKREAQIKKHCFTKLLDFTDYYRFLTLSPLLYQQKKSLSEEKLFSVVPPGIEPGTQGQRFLTLSPLLYQQKKSLSEEKLFSVVPPGIEPGTQGFSVLCSTN